MAEQSLRNKTLRGVSWSFVDSIAGQGITFLVGLILARLLTPSEYGLIGIITIFIAVFNSIVDSGFSSALIRKNDARDLDYNTVFITFWELNLPLYFWYTLEKTICRRNAYENISCQIYILTDEYNCKP